MPFIHKYFLYYPALYFKGQSIAKKMTCLAETQWNTWEVLAELQFRNMLDVLTSAKRNTSYYANKLKDVDLTNFSTINDISKIETLSKIDLNENVDSLLSVDCKKYVKKTTGGSTGNPVTVCQSPEAVAWHDAAYWRGYSWAGLAVGDAQGRFWGVPYKAKAALETKVKDFILNRMRFSAFAFDDVLLESYYVKLNRFKPQFLYGYVSMLEAFAKWMIREGRRLQFNLTCVISTSEVLTDPHRNLFEQAFGCRVFNEYGCGEIGTIAHECEQGAMHIASENVLVEIVKEGVRVEDGERGEIVVTDLRNLAMPLIRYNLKDIGSLSTDICRCGRGLPVLRDVVGRAYDTVVNKAGKSFHGEYFMYIFEEMERKGIVVSAFQVVQKSYSELVIKVKLPCDNNVELEKYFGERVHASYGNASIKFMYVDEIKRENSGKIRLIKSEMNQSRTTL